MKKHHALHILWICWIVTALCMTSASRASKPASTSLGENSILQLTGRWASGVSYSVAARENHAFIGNGASLDIVDFSNPDFPRVEQQVVLPSVIRDVVVDGNYLYVADYKGGLRIIDISNYETAFEIGSSASPTVSLDVVVQDSLAFLAEQNGGLRIVDVKNPAAPEPLGAYSTGAALGVAVSGNYAFLADGGYGLKVFDITNPENPQLIGSYTYVDEARDVTVVDKLAYIANGNSGMLILDVTDPTTPKLVSSLDTEGIAEEIIIHQNIAFIADTREGLLVVNIINPAQPNLMKTIEQGGHTIGLAIGDNILFTSTYYDGVNALNLTNPVNPMEAGYYQTADQSFGIAVQEDFAYVANNWQGLKVLDISSPEKPVERGSFDTNSWTNDLIVRDNLVFVADSREGFKIFDVSFPDQPEQIGQFPTSNAQGLALNDTLAFVTDAERSGALAGLWIIDIQDPRNPTEVGFLETNDPSDVAIQSHYAFIADGKRGFRVIDFAIPSEPREIAYYNSGNAATAVALQQNFAFVTDQRGGLRMVDISDPNKPKGAGGFSNLEDPWEIDVSGNYAAIADLELGLVLLDISTPTNPVLVENYPTGHQATNVLFEGNRLYLTDWEDGVYIFDLAVGNIQPDSPTLVKPANNAFFRFSPTQLLWNVPQDLNDDLLHFSVEVSSDPNFTSALIGSPIRSRQKPERFSPTPPLAQGTGTCQLTISEELSEGVYYWRVTAEDEELTSNPAVPFHFTVDATSPVASNHSPAKGATEVAATAAIQIQVQDSLSGVDANSIIMKIDGAAVTPNLSGSAENYTLSYQPAAPFTYGDTVVVTLDAGDNVGNLMPTDTLRFTVETLPNQAPDAPVLVSPEQRQFINSTLPEFTWQVPADADGDSLHFKLEIDPDQTWEEPGFLIESKTSSVGFSPVSPQAQGTGEITYTSQSELTEGVWWWRVAAWDGQIYGGYSEERKFLIDVTPPFSSNHQPSKDAVGVDVNTSIGLQLQDALSGIDQSTISLKINGGPVEANITGSSDNLMVSFTPAAPFAFEQLVVITIDAADSAGNAMVTEEYSFVTASEGNTAPGTPTVLHPVHQEFLNQSQPQLCWQIPADLNGDSLHFKVEVNNSVNWTEIFFEQDSRTQMAGFSPALPVASGGDSVCYAVQTELTEGTWWWRVAAWDGTVFGSYSDELSFTIDKTPPLSVNHNPSRGAEGVSIDSKISFHLTDLRSGVNPATIQLTIMGESVTPVVTGDSADYLVSFTPATPFNYEDTVQVSINAIDFVGNPMLTDNYFFVTASEINTAPAAPEIASPAEDAFIREQTPAIKWNSPTDVNGDQLHFKIEFDNDQDWTAGSLVFESRSETAGFDPEPPVIQGTGEMTYQLQNQLDEGDWWCRVAAWDGRVYGSLSNERHFIIDQTEPFLASSSPAANATNVAVNTNIEIVLKDLLSGIKRASIQMQINGSEVTPTVTGTANEYRLAYNPATDFDYEQTVTVTVDAEDLAGNPMTPQTFSFGTAAALGSLTATLLPLETPRYHEAFSIQARLNSPNPNLTGVIYYRAGGSQGYFPILMDKQDEDTFQGTIPANEVTERGIEFYLYAADNSGTVRTVPEGAPFTPPHYLQTYIEEIDFPTQTAAGVYRLITLPVELSQGQPEAVLSDDLLAYDRTRWRLFRYGENTYQEFTTGIFEDFVPGRVFWLITRDATQLDAGPGYSVPTDANYEIQLQPGWNLIGNPFSFAVSWDSTIQHGNIEAPVAFGGSENSAQGFRYQQTVLNPWEGYAVKNLETTATTLEIKPDEATASLNKAQHARLPGEWLLQLAVRCRNAEDTDNFVGQRVTASSQWDRHDFSEVPPIGDYVSLFFPHTDWEQHPGQYAADFRDVTPNGDYWDFSVVTNYTHGEVELQSHLLTDLPEPWQIFLIDKKSNRLVELKPADTYTFPAQNNDFRLIVGTSEVIENNRLQAQATPTAFQLFPNYPNPFNPETRIRYALPKAARVELVVYNLMGQKIKTIVQTLQQAGNYEVTWNAKTEKNESVPSGIYWYQLRADDFTFTRKMVLTR